MEKKRRNCFSDFTFLLEKFAAIFACELRNVLFSELTERFLEY